MLLDSARIRLCRAWVGSSGEVAEWSKANDSKSFEGQPSVGSNPTLSVSGSSRGMAQGSCGRPLIAKPHEQSIAMGGVAGCDLIKVSGIVGACWHQNSALAPHQC